MITIKCSCGRRFQTQDVNAGKRTKCPVCGSPLVVPDSDFLESTFGPPKVPATPPPWWYPKDQAKTTAVPPPMAGVGEPRPRAATPPREDATSSARDATSASRGTVKLAIVAGVGASIVLLVGVLVWVANSTTARPTPSDQADASRDRAPKAGRVPQPDIPPSNLATSLEASPPTVAASAPQASPAPPSAGREKSPESTPTDLASPAPTGRAGRPRLGLLIPAYFYPAGPGLKQWEGLIEAAARVPIVAVVNPASGPGETMNSDYGSIVRRAARRNVVVLGYVGTNYAQRPLVEVQADVDRWIRFYPEIRGIFFDAQASDANHVDYYSQLRAYARKKIGGALVVTNPGTLCDEAFAARPASDVLCIFEVSSGFENFRLPRWADRHPPGLFAALPHQVATPERMKDYIQVASTRGFGLIYVTDAKTPNPWERLPSYWDAEVEAVSKVNSGENP